MGTGLVWHERYMWLETAGHGETGFDGWWVQPGPPAGNPEPKRRMRNLLEVGGTLERLTPIAPRPATVEELTRFHTREYVERIRRESDEQGGVAGPMTAFGPGGFEIAQLAAGGVIAAADAVLDGVVDNAYALVHPAGHHATAAQGVGLCIFNNVAIAAHHLRAARGLERVAIVDWDVHFGNGTQAAFYADPSVLTISVHQADALHVDGFTGSVDERGTGAGLGANVNVPLPPGSGWGAYEAAMDRVVVPALRAFGPQAILLACGVDANVVDPLARMMLFSDHFAALTATLMAVADELCAGRLIAAQEGGYSDVYAPMCGVAVIETLAGGESQIEDAFLLAATHEHHQGLAPHQAEAIERAAAALRSTEVIHEH